MHKEKIFLQTTEHPLNIDYGFFVKIDGHLRSYTTIHILSTYKLIFYCVLFKYGKPLWMCRFQYNDKRTRFYFVFDCMRALAIYTSVNEARKGPHMCLHDFPTMCKGMRKTNGDAWLHTHWWRRKCCSLVEGKRYMCESTLDCASRKETNSRRINSATAVVKRELSKNTRYQKYWTLHKIVSQFARIFVRKIIYLLSKSSDFNKINIDFDW